jgi:hypothetical protein
VESKLHLPDDDREPARLSMQALWFCIHALLALAAWMGLMVLGYAWQPPMVSHTLILLASMLVAGLVGHIFCRFRPDEMAPVVWLLGLIWILIIALWVLDLPTGPNACNQCQASEKLFRTFFSYPTPSGLIDDDGPFIATWPTAALIGYSIGARMAMKHEHRLND